jgi:extracellular factor (EF) 3-hydroxypalmitic acid methyl ester biosynthesis protein
METLCITRTYEEILPIIEKFGPDENEYHAFNQFVNSITDEREISMLIELMKPVLNENSMFGHAFSKPFGYAGDYLLIEKMYQQHISPDPRYCKWDKFYHSQEAAKAVRNRKVYFVKILEELCRRKYGSKNVLILGSGPASDVNEFLIRNSQEDITFDLLDIDQRAIDYASKKNEKFLDKINFTRMNVLRFLPDKKYDLVWSAGLFDYLNNRLFVGLVNKFKHNLKVNGEMIIGNFSPYNPRRVQEVICAWALILRSAHHLMQLAREAGIPTNTIRVDKEPLGINLFLRMTPNGAMPLYTGRRKRTVSHKRAYAEVDGV